MTHDQLTKICHSGLVVELLLMPYAGLKEYAEHPNLYPASRPFGTCNVLFYAQSFVLVVSPMHLFSCDLKICVPLPFSPLSRAARRGHHGHGRRFDR